MRGFVKYLLLLWAGILAASCIFDADRCVMPDDEPRSVTFTVSLENQMTKAAWGDGYDPSKVGVPFDSRIMPDELSVVVFAKDGTSIGTIQNLYFWPTNESQTEFQFVGQMPEQFVNHYNAKSGEPKYRFMVLANCGGDLSEVEHITYSHAQLDPSSENASIPMWGVKEVDLSGLLDKTQMDIGTIWLLRAAARIEVKLSDDLKNKGTTTISSATLKYYNQTGYCLPSGWAGVEDTRKLDQDNCFRGYRHAAVNLPFVKDEETGDYYVYVTEYDNINYPGERNKISLEFSINDEKKYFEDAISFCKYSGGSPIEGSHYNIVRNHIYEFEVLSIAGDNLTLNYTVADWDAEDWGGGMDWKEHELAYPTYHNPVVPADYLTLTPDKIATYSIAKEPKMFYNANDLEAGAFECFFQITSPTDVQWKPAIMGIKVDYRVRVYNHTAGPDKGKLLFDSSGESNLQQNLSACPANGWYRIVVFPLSGDDAGKTDIDFMISYYQSWTDQHIHLYINGEYDHIRWPNSGNNPKLINIKHVAQETNVNE